MCHLDPGDHAEAIGDPTTRARTNTGPYPERKATRYSIGTPQNFIGMKSTHPGAATALAKVTGVIVTARVRLRAAAGCKAPSLRPAQRIFFRCLAVKRPVS